MKRGAEREKEKEKENSIHDGNSSKRMRALIAPAINKIESIQSGLEDIRVKKIHPLKNHIEYIKHGWEALAKAPPSADLDVEIIATLGAEHAKIAALHRRILDELDTHTKKKIEECESELKVMRMKTENYAKNLNDANDRKDLTQVSSVCEAFHVFAWHRVPVRAPPAQSVDRSLVQ
jgi:hypothetical protein